MSPRKDYYALLELPPPPSPISDQTIKKAYHAALLLHHPDKAQSLRKDSPTIDDLTVAYQTLSSPALRREYDAALLLAVSQRADGKEKVMQTVDLDDFCCHEDEPETRFSKSCRCGEEEGYVVLESQLEEAAEHGEVVVGCIGCSLWVRVLFGVCDETEEEPNGR